MKDIPQMCEESRKENPRAGLIEWEQARQKADWQLGAEVGIKRSERNPTNY